MSKKYPEWYELSKERWQETSLQRVRVGGKELYEARWDDIVDSFRE